MPLEWFTNSRYVFLPVLGASGRLLESASLRRTSGAALLDSMASGRASLASRSPSPSYPGHALRQALDAIAQKIKADPAILNFMKVLIEVAPCQLLFNCSRLVANSFVCSTPAGATSRVPVHKKRIPASPS